MASSLRLVTRKGDDAPTYERGGNISHIYVTFTSQGVVRQINEWRVLEMEIGSDHKCIFFLIQGRTQLPCISAKLWSWRNMDVAKLESFLNSYTHPDEEMVFDNMD